MSACAQLSLTLPSQQTDKDKDDSAPRGENKSPRRLAFIFTEVYFAIAAIYYTSVRPFTLIC